MPSYQTLTCPQCNLSLCIDCVLAYTPETAFPMHLACYAEPSSLKLYTANKECARTLMRDPYMAPVYYEYQRFYNTEEYIHLLEERVVNIEQEINLITLELKSTHDRMSSTKLELLNARRLKKISQEASVPSD